MPSMPKPPVPAPPPEPPVLVVIDEAANVAPLAQLPQVASTARSHGIQLITVWQDMAQAEERYRSSARTLFNNHRAKLLLSGCADLSTLQYFSQLLGEVEVQETSTHRDPVGRRSSTDAPRHRALAPVEWIRQMRPGEALLVYGALRPACACGCPSPSAASRLESTTPRLVLKTPIWAANGTANNKAHRRGPNLPRPAARPIGPEAFGLPSKRAGSVSREQEASTPPPSCQPATPRAALRTGGRCGRRASASASGVGGAGPARGSTVLPRRCRVLTDPQRQASEASTGHRRATSSRDAELG